MTTDDLSDLEIRIAVCIAEGLTNRLIAERLGLDEQVVARHLAHILRTLGLRNRVQVAVWAVRQGLC